MSALRITEREGAVRIVAGESSRTKVVEVEGVSAEAVQALGG